LKMDYNKLKVTELKEMLSTRGLPTSGNKSDLVARLSDADTKADDPQKAVDFGDDLLPPEDEIDWDAGDTKKRLPDESANSLTDSAAKPAEAKPAVPVAPAAAPKTSPEAPPSSETKDEPATSANDAAALAAIEFEKRKKRAERFGIPLNDNAKALERAQRFGVTPKAPKQQLGGGQRPKNNRGGGQGAQTSKPGAAPAAPKAPKAKVIDDPVEAEKARKRAERFGGGNEPKKVKT
jgi:SAP domain-containing ribonucleoprotein